jgi:hypothetical protein
MLLSACTKMPSLFVGSRMEGYQDGTGENVKFGRSLGMAIDKDGNLFIGDNSNHRIRKVTPEGKVTTFAGTGEKDSRDGDLKTASFEFISDMKFDSKGNLFVADKNILKKITPEGSVTTFAGNGKVEIKDGSGIEASFAVIDSIFIDKKDNIYSIDDLNVIRIISTDSKVKTYNLESKLSINEFYRGLIKILVDKDENIFILVQKNISENELFSVFKITKESKVIQVISNELTKINPREIIFDEDENIYALDTNKRAIYKINSEGKETKEITKFQIWFPIFNSSFFKGWMNSLEIDNKRKILYISNYDSYSIYKVKLEGDK